MKNRRVVLDGRRYPVHRAPLALITDRVVDTALSSGYVIAEDMTILKRDLDDRHVFDTCRSVLYVLKIRASQQPNVACFKIRNSNSDMVTAHGEE